MHMNFPKFLTATPEILRIAYCLLVVGVPFLFYQVNGVPFLFYQVNAAPDAHAY